MSMQRRITIITRRLCAAALGLALCACGLPRGGPTPEEIAALPQEAALAHALVPVTDAVARAAELPDASGFPPAFFSEAPVSPDRIAVGERLRLRVWENVESGVYSLGEGPRAAPFEMRVSGSGSIRVPYVGEVPAAGRTESQLAAALETRLQPLTADPQVEVLRDAATPDGPAQSASAVLVLGEVAAGGVRPISRHTARLTGVLAAALGPVQDPATLRVTLRRDGRSGMVWLRQIYDRPELDIAVRPGDAVIVDRDRRAFTGLGAFGAAMRVPFPSPRLSALEALGLLRGLDPNTGDPTGIFLFRTEPPQIAAAVAAAAGAAPPPPGRPVRTAYLLDLTQPGGMFIAAAFSLRDGDALYATDAPAMRWIKVLNALAPSVNFANSAKGLAGG